MLCFGGSPPLAWGQPEPRRAYDIPLAVHPHSRGDNIVYLTIQHVTDGSPPLAWGQLLDEPGVVIVFDGSPPLAWGQHCRRPDAWIGQTVHPHSRGDNEGLPRSEHQLRRFTPTRVGTTLSGTIRSARPTVHPHSRGDNPRSSRRSLWTWRFTPTRVGTTELWIWSV